MPDKEQALDKAVNDAADKLLGGGDGEKAAEKDAKGEEKPEITIDKEETETEESEEAGDEESELSDNERDESLRLYKALKDPKTAGPIIAALAQQAGFLNGKAGETKTEEKKQAKAVKDILGEALGQYKFLADALTPAIEQILEQERESSEQKFAEIQQSRIEQEVVSAYNALAKETKGESRQLEAQMTRLSEEIPIGKMTVETYIRRLYTVAAGEKSKSSPKAVADKIRRNANDATSRLQGTRGGEESTRSLPKEKMNINQSINWALEQIAQQQKGK